MAKTFIIFISMGHLIARYNLLLQSTHIFFSSIPGQQVSSWRASRAHQRSVVTWRRRVCSRTRAWSSRWRTRTWSPASCRPSWTSGRPSGTRDSNANGRRKKRHRKRGLVGSSLYGGFWLFYINNKIELVLNNINYVTLTDVSTALPPSLDNIIYIILASLDWILFKIWNRYIKILLTNDQTRWWW